MEWNKCILLSRGEVDYLQDFILKYSNEKSFIRVIRAKIRDQTGVG